MNDEDEIARFIVERGVTIVPPAPAAQLGEISPGWRRRAEASNERAGKRGRRRQQNILAARQSGVPLTFAQTRVRRSR